MAKTGDGTDEPVDGEPVGDEAVEDDQGGTEFVGALSEALAAADPVPEWVDRSARDAFVKRRPRPAAAPPETRG